MSNYGVDAYGLPEAGTTAERPDGAFVGKRYFDTDTQTLMVYNGSTWQEAGDSPEGDILAGSITGGDSSLGITGSAGTASAAASAGGAGGAVPVAGGAGGANTGGATGEAGGAGGAGSVTGGVGGATNSTGAHAGGAGGDVSLTAGAGGAASAGTGDGGVGGDVEITAGAGGTSAGGDAGAPGKINLNSLVRLPVQTIDMADAAVTLTLVPGTPTGTLLTGNILYVDANSGASENLLLPPEADGAGVPLTIVNTGGETINIQNDAGGSVLTLETANTAYLDCDGTTWRGTVGVV